MKEIRIGDKVPTNIGLHEFPPLVVEKVPKVKLYNEAALMEYRSPVKD